MSKSWAPAPDGLPTHSTKVRVIGGNTPEAQAVLDDHWGQVSQYINAQHQRVQLSGLPQHKSSTTIGGVRVTYTNNNGQDTVVVEVTAQLGGEETKAEATTYWDWALIDMEFSTIVTDLGFGTQTSEVDQLAAQLEGPKTSEQKAMTDDTRMPVQGVTAQDWYSSPRPVLQLADAFAAHDVQVIAEEAATEDRSTSLRVDLRNYAGQVVKAGIYGVATQTPVPVPFTLKAVCVRGGNPWTGLVKRASLVSSQADSYIFVVPSIYPRRPSMASIGSGEIPIDIPLYANPDFSDLPSKMFGLGKAGEVHIDTRSGHVKFVSV